jgi:hypothetical protein
LPNWRPGQIVNLQIARNGVTRMVKFRVGANQEVSAQIEEDPQADPGQLRVREGWLDGVSHSSPGER